MDFHNLGDHIPFMVGAVAGGVKPKLSGTRITEAIIIAAITALATSYVTVAKIETKVDIRDGYYQEQFKSQVARRDAELSAMKAAAAVDSARRQAQYETLRSELQRLAIAIERAKR